jgi:hypothetical protein
MDQPAEDENNCSSSLYRTVSNIDQEDPKEKEEPAKMDKDEKVLKELEDSKII